MNINIGLKRHNRFDIEVKDILTEKIVQKAYAENIILNKLFETTSPLMTTVLNNYAWANKIYFGKGTGTISASRISLFNQLGFKNVELVETVYNQPPTASYAKYKIVILSLEQVGETITEVGVGGTTGIYTHALIKDAEGSNISIGPKTDTQEITIYATIFANVTLPDNTLLLFPSGVNRLLETMLGRSGAYDRHVGYEAALKVRLFTDKTVTNTANGYQADSIAILPPSGNGSGFEPQSVGVGKTTRFRADSSVGNGKIWSLALNNLTPSNANKGSVFRMLLPNSLWQGYHFEGKSIDVGDGSTKTFALPWSDINTTKQYDIYVDGAKKTAGVDYTLSNSESATSVTFTNAPANNAVITGDWWVDYIPKDTDHVLDLTFTITYGEGA